MLKKMSKENEEYSFHSFLLTLALQTKTCILSTFVLYLMFGSELSLLK